MNSLIIDCSAGMSVFLLKDKETFFHEDLNQKKHTDELLLEVSNLLEKAKISVDEIDNFCVCVGPGSFTGIRVAVSIVKGLAVTSDSKIFELSNFDIYDTCGSKKFKLVLEGFSDFVYVRSYEDDVTLDECVSFDDLVKVIKENDFDVFVQTEKLQNKLKNVEIQSKIAQKQTIFAFIQKLNQSECVMINEINPVYLRASQAEIERNNKLSGGK